MSRTLRLMLTLLLLASLASCAGSSSDRAATPTIGERESRPAGGGGELIMSLAVEIPTLDPATTADATSAFVVRQLYSGLVKLSNELQVEPDLAARWDISDDKRTYTFHLAPNIAFADGRPITAEDVRWSLERAISRDLSPSPPAATYLTDIEGAVEKLSGEASSVSGIKVIDERTISLTLREPNAVFLLKLTNPPSFVVDRRSVEEGGEDWTSQPNGSGPFTLAELTDENLKLRPNLNYHGPLPKLDQLTLLLGAAGANELLLYEQGKVDYAEVPSYALARVSDESSPLSRELVTVPSLSLTYIGMNVNMPPFDDANVRRALSLLIDRARLVDADEASSAVAAAGIVPPEMPGANKQLTVPPADVERAKQLLAQSRYGSAEGLPPIIGYSVGGSVGLLAELMEQTLGITMEVRTAESFASYLQNVDARRYAIFDLSWIADYPDPENFVAVLFGAGSGSNYTGYNNPEVEQLFAQARAEENPERRYQLYQQAEQIILEDAPAIPLYHSVTNALIKPYVKGLTVTPQGLLDMTQVELAR